MIETKTAPDMISKNLLTQWDQDAGECLGDVQERALQKRLLQYQKHPAFGTYGLSTTMSRRDFLAKCPIFTAAETQAFFQDSSFSDSWVTEGEIDVFALSSGTTAAKRKIYPITSEYLASFEHFRFLAAELFTQFIPDPTHLTKHMLAVTAQRGLDSHMGKPVMPMTWYMNIGRGTEIPDDGPIVHYSRIFQPDFSVKDEVCLDEIKKLDIGSIGAMPPYVLAMFEGLKKRFSIKSFRDIWPDASLYRLFGFSRGPYLERLREAFGGDFQIIEMYVASEGIFGIQRVPEDSSLQLLPYEIVFAFHDLEADKVLLPEDTEIGKVYSLVVTSPAGCLSYAMGDSVRVVSKNPFRFVFAERTDESLRLGTEIMSLSDFNSWMNEASLLSKQKFGAFIVGPNQNRSGHSFILEVARGQRDEISVDHLCQILDEAMKRDNSYYRNQRRSGFMKSPEVHLTELGMLDKVLIRKETIGQGKYKRVFNDRDALDKVLNHVASV